MKGRVCFSNLPLFNPLRIEHLTWSAASSVSSLFLILLLQALLELNGWATAHRFTLISTTVILLPMQGTQQVWALKGAHQTPCGLVHVAKTGLCGLCLCQCRTSQACTLAPRASVTTQLTSTQPHSLRFPKQRGLDFSAT